MKRISKIAAGCAALFLSANLFALEAGVYAPIVLVSDNPASVHDLRAGLWFQPQSTVWGPWHLYFTGNVGHWWSNANTKNRILNIVAVAPVIRYYFFETKNFSPFIDASIGPAYMSRTRFGCRNLGIHFTFQDELGVGATFGLKKEFYASLSVLHYSNGHLSAHNSGITMPLMLNVGYKFL